MNSKVVSAFVGGLILAFGITYMALRTPQTPISDSLAHSAAAPAQTEEKLPPATGEAAPLVVNPDVKSTPEPVQRRASSSPAAVQKRPVEHVVPAPYSIPPPPKVSEKPAPVFQPTETARAPEPAPVYNPPAPAPRVEPPPPPKPNTVTIPSGTTLSVRLGQTLSTERNKLGDTFTATLDQPLVADGFVIAERGSRAEGHVVECDRSGKVKGVAQLGVELTRLWTADGQKIRINTAAFQKKADTTKKTDAAKVGLGAALGAAIGAIAGGGKGAGIGAGAGGAAGAGDVLLTRGKAAELPVETKLSFRLSEPVTITEQLK
jgi:hypothetical protein